MKKYCYCMASLLIIFSGCSNDSNIQQLIIKQNLLQKISLNQEISNDNDRNLFYLKIYDSDSTLQNEYFFEKHIDGDSIYFSLTWDSIQFNTDNIVIRENICEYYQQKIEIMESYDIKGLSNQKYKNHPSHIMTILLENGKMLDYIPQWEKLNDVDLKDYKIVGEGWFLRR